MKTIHETWSQKILRKLYPIIRKIGKKGKNGTVFTNNKNIEPIISLYTLQVILNNGKTLNFSELHGKKILLVNTASNCGYTGQYAELQTLYTTYGKSIEIIGFPANDFAEQEKSDDTEIAQFCQRNYGVTFPIALKGVVRNCKGQQSVFQWLCDVNKNGWNNHAPDWNFGKYIINEDGVLTHYFGPSISPLEDIFLQAIR